MDNLDGITVTVTLPSETVTDIKTLSRRLGLTPSELLQRAVRIEKYLDDVEINNGKVLIESSDRKIGRITQR